MIMDEALGSNLSTTSSYFCVEAFNSLVPYLGDDQSVSLSQRIDNGLVIQIAFVAKLP